MMFDIISLYKPPIDVLLGSGLKIKTIHVTLYMMHVVIQMESILIEKNRHDIIYCIEMCLSAVAMQSDDNIKLHEGCH